MNRKRIIILSLSLSFPLLLFSFCNIYAQQNEPVDDSSDESIILSDPKLKIELVASGLDFPTTMGFLGPDDFLILEKAGTVKRVTNGVILNKPLLQVDVSVKDERGLLGIVICEKKNTGCENRVYRYDLDNKNNILINPKLLLSIPSFPDPAHIGGIIDIGPDNNLYV